MRKSACHRMTSGGGEPREVPGPAPLVPDIRHTLRARLSARDVSPLRCPVLRSRFRARHTMSPVMVRNPEVRKAGAI